MNHTIQFECMDKECGTVIIGRGCRLDGIRCPRCDGPVKIMPFKQHVKDESTLAVYQCLRCDHRDRVQGSKEEYSEVKVCPKCNGAFVDVWHIAKHKKQIVTLQNNEIVIPLSIGDKQIAELILRGK